VTKSCHRTGDNKGIDDALEEVRQALDELREIDMTTGWPDLEEVGEEEVEEQEVEEQEVEEQEVKVEVEEDDGGETKRSPEVQLLIPCASAVYANSTQANAATTAPSKPMFLCLTADKPVSLPLKKKDEQMSLSPDKKGKSTFLCLT
jgi:hypothetical protein